MDALPGSMPGPSCSEAGTSVTVKVLQLRNLGTVVNFKTAGCKNSILYVRVPREFSMLVAKPVVWIFLLAMVVEQM